MTIRFRGFVILEGRETMLISRIDTAMLGVLCERVGVAFEVGHDPFKIFDREAGEGKSAYGRHMKSVADRVRNGSTLAEAVAAQGNYFPPNFINFIDVGEKTGRLDRVLSRMSDYYKNLAELRSSFVSSIIWPMVQLVIGLIVVSVLIYMPLVIADMQQAAGGGEEAEAPDLLGLGLVGWSGLATLWGWVLAIAAALVALYVLMRNGHLNGLYRVLTRVPVVGKALLAFDEASFIQTLSMAIESGVNASDAISLAFKTCSAPLFQAKAKPAFDAIRQGRQMHLVLKDTGLFSPDTLDAVHLGEESGRLAETLDKHFQVLRMKVRFAMTTLTQLASTLVWIVISSLLIFIIFKIFSRYLAMGPGGVDATIEKVLETRRAGE